MRRPDPGGAVPLGEQEALGPPGDVPALLLEERLGQPVQPDGRAPPPRALRGGVARRAVALRRVVGSRARARPLLLVRVRRAADPRRPRRDARRRVHGAHVRLAHRARRRLPLALRGAAVGRGVAPPAQRGVVRPVGRAAAVEGAARRAVDAGRRRRRRPPRRRRPAPALPPPRRHPRRGTRGLRVDGASTPTPTPSRRSSPPTMPPSRRTARPPSRAPSSLAPRAARATPPSKPRSTRRRRASRSRLGWTKEQAWSLRAPATTRRCRALFRTLRALYSHRVALKANMYDGHVQLQVDVGDDQIFFGWASTSPRAASPPSTAAWSSNTTGPSRRRSPPPSRRPRRRRRRGGGRRARARARNLKAQVSQLPAAHLWGAQPPRAAARPRRRRLRPADRGLLPQLVDPRRPPPAPRPHLCGLGPPRRRPRRRPAHRPQGRQVPRDSGAVLARVAAGGAVDGGEDRAARRWCRHRRGGGAHRAVGGGGRQPDGRVARRPRSLLRGAA